MKINRIVTFLGLFLLASQVNAQNVENSSVSNVIAKATGSTSVQVSWRSLEDAIYYDIYQNGQRIETLVSDTSLDVLGLQPGTLYQYFVTGCNESGKCSVPGGQAEVYTAGTITVDGADVCPATTDGSSPVVELTPNQDGTALLSWCQMADAQGYNLFLNNFYDTTFDRFTFSATVPFDGSQQYQIAWFAGDNYPPKSEVAVATTVELPTNLTDMELLVALDAVGTDTDVEIYFTRHAEKETQLAKQHSLLLTP